MKSKLTQTNLRDEAKAFAITESSHAETAIYGTTDGKAIGTYIEHKFQSYLHTKYTYEEGSSANGIDFPGINVDMKVTSVKQPQSSCPFKSARQKIFGLGYALLVFVYEKTDDDSTRTATLNIVYVIFVEDERTGDFQTTRGLREIVQRDGNTEDIVAFMVDRNLPLDDIKANTIAEEILKAAPNQGHVTISNALQWRLRYARTIGMAGNVEGIFRVL